MTDTPPRSAADALEKLEAVRKRLSNRRSTDDVLIKIIMTAIAQEVRPWIERVQKLERRIEELEQRKYVGVWKEGEIYHPGNQVTLGGSIWYCKRGCMSRPGTDPEDWQLQVKRGRDGRDAR